MTVDVDIVLDKYESKKAKDIKLRHPGWKAERPIKKETELAFDRAFATWAAHNIAKYCDASFPDVFQSVECLQKPRQMAIAKAACPVGQLVIAPEALKVSSYKTAEMHEVKADRRAQITLLNTSHPDYTFLLDPWVEKERAAAFWFVETTDDPAKANMTYATGSYDCTSGTELTAPTGISIMPRPPPEDAAQDDTADEGTQGCPKKRKTGKAASPSVVVTVPDDAHKHIARIPILINHKALKKDDVLMAFVKSQPQSKAPAPVKRIRVAQARRLS